MKQASPPNCSAPRNSPTAEIQDSTERLRCRRFRSWLLAAQAIALLAWTSPANAELIELNARGFFMAADPSCVQRPILQDSVWVDCDFDGRKVEIVAKGDADLDWSADFLGDVLAVDSRTEMLAALVADTPLREYIGQTQGMWGVGTAETLVGEAFLHPPGTHRIRDVRKMVMFHAAREGSRTMGVVAVGDVEIIEGNEAKANGAITIYRLPNSVRVMLKSFRILDVQF